MEQIERFGYWAIQWSADWDPSLTDLLRLVPEIVCGKRVAITSCDSGPYRPSAAEISAGWSFNGTTGISKVIVHYEELPTPGFDEWYVFDSPPLLIPTRNHVNRYNFSVIDECDATASFWEQIRLTQPLHVLGAGTPNMFFVTRDQSSFDRVQGLAALT